jgi:integrase
MHIFLGGRGESDTGPSGLLPASQKPHFTGTSAVVVSLRLSHFLPLSPSELGYRLGNRRQAEASGFELTISNWGTTATNWGTDMARGIKEKLNVSKLKTKKPGRYSDGGNLYLEVSRGRNGSIRRSWLFRFKLPGRPERDMGLGGLDDIGMARAREFATSYREMVKTGLDPIVERDAAMAKKIAAAASIITFKEAAQTYIAQHRPGWKNVVHSKQWPSTLETYVYPTLGRMSVADIETAHVMKVLTPIWHNKVDTAKRVRGRVEAILGWATASGYRKDENGHDRPNPARWRGHLDKLLAAPSRVRQVEHQKALPYADMPRFTAALHERNGGIGSLALEFAIVTLVRTADVRNAKWEDIDRAARMWVIPKFSKTHREHRVALSDAALAVLDKAQQIARDIGGKVAQSECIFANDVSGKALSENAMLAVLKRMGHKGNATTHGFRSSFRTWAQERTNFPWELAEMSLGHKVGNEVQRAYARGDMLRKRFAIMQAWANFCNAPIVEEPKVVAFARP